MSLAILQTAFADFVHDRPSDIAAALADTRGLAVYHHAYRATLCATLSDTFAKTVAWLGEDVFDTIARAYVAATPSTSWTLADYGAEFAGCLADTYPDDPEVAELAWLEWSLRYAFAARDAVPVDGAALAAADWETAGLAFAPGVAARRITADVPGIWHALEAERAPARIMLERPLGLVVWRAGTEPRFASIDADEADALVALLSGMPFVRACATAAAAGVDSDRVGSWLGRWIGDGLVTAITAPSGAAAR